MVSQTSFRRETSEVSRNAGFFLRIEDSPRGRRDRSREAGKFWMSGCEDVGKAARISKFIMICMENHEEFFTLANFSCTAFTTTVA